MPQGDSLFTPKLAEAFAYAVQLHGTQVRKQAKEEVEQPGIPYMAHLMAVAALVLENGGDEDEAIAALLHDGPEDQGGQRTLDRIRSEFGDGVADIVAGCSDTLVEDRSKKPEWKARKKAYLRHLEKTESESVFLISVADKVHNLHSILADYRRIGEELWARFTGKRKGTLWYYRKLLKIYRKKAPPRCTELVAEMERTYRELRRLTEATCR